MPKKLSETEKKEMIKSFCNGISIDQLSDRYKITKITITRHLKKEIDEKQFKRIIEKNNKNKSESKNEFNKKLDNLSNTQEVNHDEISNDIVSFNQSEFIEITPLDYEINSEVQKDLSSVSINEIELPKIVYMVVDNKIELETKLLRDYPDWQFLSNKDLSRTSIEVFFDIKIAKRNCSKEQKVIKVPNTDVFRIVAPILVSRGISRIICPETLISL